MEIVNDLSAYNRFMVDHSESNSLYRLVDLGPIEPQVGVLLSTAEPHEAHGNSSEPFGKSTSHRSFGPGDVRHQFFGDGKGQQSGAKSSKRVLGFNANDMKNNDAYYSYVTDMSSPKDSAQGDHFSQNNPVQWFPDVCANPYLHSSLARVMSTSYTCSDGCSSNEDHLQQLIFDQNQTVARGMAPLEAWLPDSAKFSFASPATSDPAANSSYSGDSSDHSNDKGVLRLKREDVVSVKRVENPETLEAMFSPSRNGSQVDTLDGSVLTSHMSFRPGEGLISTMHYGSHSLQDSFHEHSSNVSFNFKLDKMDDGIQNRASERSIENTFMQQHLAAINVGDHVEIQQDNTREFGLNPILGSPLAATRTESDYNEICLVHLLIAGAEAVATRDMDLASVILVRLKELVSRSGSTMQRVSAYFTEGLQCCISSQTINRAGYIKPQSEMLAAFQILHEILPYIKFGHFTANQAILDAVEEERCVHIIDYEIMEGIQWPPLMQALALRKGGAPNLRITALYRPNGERGLATVHETGKWLTEFASSLDIPFSFGLLRINDEEEFSVSDINHVDGEALVVNCMLHLPHMPHKTSTVVSSFLQAMHSLNPILLTLVEEELGSCRSAAASFFSEALRHYSAICDSLEACLSTEIAARMLVEQVFLAPRINRTVTVWSGSSLSESGSFSKHNWCSLVCSIGFKSLPLASQNISQARLLLDLYRDGFKLYERSNRLLLGWQNRPLFAASAWN